MSRGIGEIATGANEVARNVAEAAAGINSMNTKLSETSTMVSDANLCTIRSSEASSACAQRMQDMMVAVERVCDVVLGIDAPTNQDLLGMGNTTGVNRMRSESSSSIRRAAERPALERGRNENLRGRD